MSGREIQALRASQVQRERVEWCWPGRVPYGSVTVIVGDGGLGKSTWASLLAGEVSNDAGDVLIVSAEDSVAATLKPRLEAVSADLDRVHFVSMQTEQGDEDGLVIPEDMPQLEQLVSETQARLVVIDPLVAHLSERLNSWSDHSVRKALAPLHRLAESTRCAVVSVLHLNKGTSSDPMRRIGGSVAFGNAARSVLVMARDPEDAEGSRRILAHVKCNLAPLAPSVAYEIEPIVLPGSGSEPDAETTKLRLIGETAHVGHDLLERRDADDDQQGSALKDAKRFLEAELTDGPVESKLIQVNAKQAGVAYATLRRAGDALKVRKEKGRSDGRWRWSLPTCSTSPYEQHEQVEQVEQDQSNKGLGGHLGSEVAHVAQLRDMSNFPEDELERLRRKLRESENGAT